MRLAMQVEYDGSEFSGWQSQSHAPSIQDAVQAALSAVADCPISVVCAGRTDAGVHAYGQVIHFDSEVEREPQQWLRGGNAHLPHAVRITAACRVSDDFHARSSAIARHYRYVILNDGTPAAVLRNFCSHVYQPLDAECMHEAAQALLGEHDFSSFRGAGCQSRSPVREVKSISVTRRGRFVYLDICANAFLQHMVRNIAGSLLEIGTAERAIGWLAEVLAQRDRTLAGVALSGAGLYLVHVDYGDACRFSATIRVPQFETLDEKDGKQ